MMNAILFFLVGVLATLSARFALLFIAQVMAGAFPWIKPVTMETVVIVRRKLASLISALAAVFTIVCIYDRSSLAYATATVAVLMMVHAMEIADDDDHRVSGVSL